MDKLTAKAKWIAETIKACSYKDKQGGKACVEIDAPRYCVSCSARS